MVEFMKFLVLCMASQCLVAVSAFVTPETTRMLQSRSSSLSSSSPTTTTTTTSRTPPSDYSKIGSPRRRLSDAPRFVAHSSKSSTNEGSPKKKKKSRLSRPERKALERAKKGNNNNNNNNKKKNGNAQPQTRRRYDLHSTAVSELTKDSSPEDVIRAMKRAQKNHDSHDLRVITRFLLEETDDSYAYGYKGSLLARLAVAALHLQHHSVARQAITKRRVDFRSSMLPLESAALVRNLLRVHNVTDAWNVLEDELSLPLEGTLLTDPGNRDRLKYRALALASIASRHFFGQEPYRAVYACSRIADLGPLLHQAQIKPEDLELPWSRLLRGASQCQSAIRSGEVDLENVSTTITKTTAQQQQQQQQHVVNGDGGTTAEYSRRAQQLPCNLVYAVLNAMLSVPSTNGDREYEILSNSLVRRVVFVTGAVDMEGCPPADRGEAAFVGRSNVGKSSLVNMVTNRKSLAYTSKRPGKTQQFNFFAVNDKPGREKEIKYGDHVDGEKDEDAFYIVDLPGFGYAKVPDQQRQQWAAFMDEFISSRENLRVLFHLVDGRHGATDEDKTIMKRVSNILPPHVRYVVVLTKADKNVKGPNKTNTGRVSMEIQNDLKQTMQENGVGYAPVVLTSAETKLGRDGVWNYLRLAAER